MARLAEIDMPQVAAAFSPASADDFVDARCHGFEYLAETTRTQTTARLVLFMEASHMAALWDALSQGRATLEAVGVVARHDDTDPRPILTLVVRAALP